MSFPVNLTLPPLTRALLRLPEEAHHWPGTGAFVFPDVCVKADDYMRLMSTGLSVWKRAACVAAILPARVGGAPSFDVVVNGVRLGEMDAWTAQSFHRRLLRKGIGPCVTTCDALLDGGGTLADGRQRTCFLALDMKPFR